MTTAESATPFHPAVGPLDIGEILDRLPHRYPFLLVDRVLVHVPGSHLVAIKNVTVNEPFFQGHFPGRPTMPGVLILEAMAQAAGVMVVRERGGRAHDGTLLYFAAVDRARFRRAVTPGDVLTLRVRPLKCRPPLFRFAVAARVDDDLACEAELTAIARTPPPGQGATR